MKNVKVVQVNGIEGLEKALKDITGEIFGKSSTIEKEVEKMKNDTLEENRERLDETVSNCYAVERLLEGLELTRKESVEVLSLVLRKMTAQSEDKSIMNLLDEQAKDLFLLDMLHDVFDMDKAEEMLEVIASTASVLAIKGQEAVDEAIHLGKRVAAEMEAKKSNESVNVDELIKNIINNK